MQGSCFVLLALVGFAAAQVQLNLEFEYLNKFGNVKARQGCFGIDETAAHYARVDAAVTKCFAEFRAPEISSFNGAQNLATLFRKKRDSPRRYSFGRSSSSSSSDSIRYPADEVSRIADEIRTEVDYFRCVMREMEITDSDNNLNTKAIVQRLKSQDMPKNLEDDMVHAVTQCSKYATCIPPGKDSYPLPNDVVVAKHYIYCEHQLRAVACLKRDARWLLDDFDLSGTDGRLDFLDTDQDRVAALLFANNIVGPDDYGLYE